MIRHETCLMKHNHKVIKMNINIELLECPEWAACGAKLKVTIDGESFIIGDIIEFEGKEYYPLLRSGGNVYFDEEMDEHIEYGPWTVVDIPEKFIDRKEVLEEKINEIMPIQGCCGGCI